VLPTCLAISPYAYSRVPSDDSVSCFSPSGQARSMLSREFSTDQMQIFGVPTSYFSCIFTFLYVIYLLMRRSLFFFSFQRKWFVCLNVVRECFQFQCDPKQRNGKKIIVYCAIVYVYFQITTMIAQLRDDDDTEMDDDNKNKNITNIY
jgi:hypothetical protein